MTDQGMCTQYELFVALIESGNTEKAVEILKGAINRMNGQSAASKKDGKKK